MDSQNGESLKIKKHVYIECLKLDSYARFNLSRLSLTFILKYYPILHAVKR